MPTFCMAENLIPIKIKQEKAWFFISSMRIRFAIMRSHRDLHFLKIKLYMKKIKTTLLITFLAVNAGSIAINAQQKKASAATEKSMNNNPFLKKSPFQYQAPEFDKIKDDHFKPAFEFGLKEQLANIDKIVNNKAVPTFENTVLALETSGETLGRATILFYNLTSSNTNDELQKLEEEYAPIFASHSDKIYLNDKLYKKIKAVKTDKLDAESKRLTE